MSYTMYVPLTNVCSVTTDDLTHYRAHLCGITTWQPELFHPIKKKVYSEIKIYCFNLKEFLCVDKR